MHYAMKGKDILMSYCILKKNREKEAVSSNSVVMDRYTANYTYTNCNFVIQNNLGKVDKESRYYKLICILKNILMRGCPTHMSQFLKSNFSELENKGLLRQEVQCLIAKETPIWIGTICGDDRNNDYPAKTFIEEIIPEYLPEYAFVQQLILPEVSFADITGNFDNELAHQRVDFYLPQVKLAIEIDGRFHFENKQQKLKDKERNEFLKRNNVKLFRISTNDIRARNDNLAKIMGQMRNYLSSNRSELEGYMRAHLELLCNENDYYNNVKNFATAIIRFQILILDLIEKGKLSLEDKEWKISVVERDVCDFEELAIKDLFLWIRNLAKLLKINFKEPEVTLKRYSQEYSKFEIGYINVDFSITKRWTDENCASGEEDRIYVRTDYFDDRNYFEISTYDFIRYDIIEEGEDSDIEALLFMLKNIFGYDGFKDGQLQTIINVLRGGDTIGILPTGSGKSLIYQYVTLLQPCMTIVVCPIKSLMLDQRDNLDKIGIDNSDYINSTLEAEEKKVIMQNTALGKNQFLWVAPERFQSEEFRDTLLKLNNKYCIGLIVIDEVHCLSEWGHDFRTSYLNLAKTIRKYCSEGVVLGLTATASANVLKDIKAEFNITTNNVKTVLSFTRNELHFKIRDYGDNKFQSLVNLIRAMDQKKSVFSIRGEDSQCGIIFTKFVNKGTEGCFGLAEKLSYIFKKDVRWYSGTIPKKSYFSNLSSEEEFNEYKEHVQKDFKDNKYTLLVATKAFGMGIDKNNVRYTIHYGIPESLEALYQEAGRAGRDGNDAGCYILISLNNKKKEEQIKTIIENPNVNMAAINEIIEEKGYDNLDIVDNLYFWKMGHNGIKAEVSDILYVYNACQGYSGAELIGKINTYSECKEEKIINVDLSKIRLEKAIYKLSLLGVIDDWTVLSWNPEYPKIRIVLKEHNNKSMVEHLLKYIRKYEVGYEIVSEYVDSIEKITRKLIEWQYEKIAYHRRQQICTVYEQCIKNIGNEEELQKYIEGYFRFGEATYIFENLVDKPNDYKEWFNVFYQDNGDIKETSEIDSDMASLRRFLETLNNNVALNYLSGMMNLLLGDYEKEDGKIRFQNSLNQLMKENDETLDYVIDNTLDLSVHMCNESKERLVEEILKRWPSRALQVYEKTKSDRSLVIALEWETERIKAIRRRMENGCN